MRKLSPFKAVYHALNSVWSYRAVALRIGMVWAPVLLIAGLLEYFSGPAAPATSETMGQAFIEILAGVISIAAVCSMGVSWHRFILRDELRTGLRIDSHVLRYAGNTLLIMLAMLAPSLVLVSLLAFMPAQAAFIGVPLVIVAGVAATRLSIKLPAVALGNRGFGFREAWAASAGNFWPCAGVFLLNGAIILVMLLALTLVAGFLATVNEALSLVFQLLSLVALQVFYAIFNASIFTSLYGFFVERRDF